MGPPTAVGQVPQGPAQRAGRLVKGPPREETSGVPNGLPRYQGDEWESGPRPRPDSGQEFRICSSFEIVKRKKYRII